MQILYIWDADYPWDVRVKKICQSLHKHGHYVHIAARNLKRLPVYENIEGLHIDRLKTWKNEKLNYTLSFPAFFNPLWRRFLDLIIKKNKIELIIVRDLPMAIAGIWAGKKNYIPVVFDIAEDYVAMIWDIWRARKFQGLNLIVRNPYLARLVERYAFKKADHVLVVIDEAKEVVLRGGGDIEKITIVGNTPPLDLFRDSNIILNDTLKLIEKRFSAIYIGGIQMGRGIQTVIDAIPIVIKEIPDFLFVVVGDGYATARLQKKIKEKQVQNHVLWIGWVDHKNIFDYIRASKIGVIPHLASDHVNTTVPNKIFDFMGAGVPVIASDATPMKRILEEAGCGVTFRSGDHVDLARAFLEIKKFGQDYGKNGSRAVKRKYNWREDEKRLLGVINRFC